MRRIGLLVLTFFLCISSSFGACESRRVYAGQFRSTFLDVFVRESLVWTADSQGVRLYDGATDPPAVIRTRPLPGTSTRVVADGSRAWIASGTAIYVVSNPDLEIRGSVDLEAPISDLLLDSPWLYAATQSGVVQLDLFDPETPTVAKTLPTGTGRSFSLARLGGFLYAADGDTSIEVYSLQIPSLPQNVGTISTLQSTISVQSDGARLFASDGRSTEIFTGTGASMARTGTLPGVGAKAFAATLPAIAFVAGQDSTIRAVDVSSLAVPIVLFEERLQPGGGTTNRVEAMATGHGRLYVAAGDIGLVTYDIDSFHSVFPIRSHLVGPHTSVVTDGGGVWSSPSSGGIDEFSVSSNGTLTLRRSWRPGAAVSLHSIDDDSLLVSSSSDLERWSVVGASPQLASSASLDSFVTSAVLSGNTAFAVTASGTLWRVDLSGPAGQAANVTPPGTAPRFVSLAGRRLVLTDLDEAGTSTFRHYADFDQLSDPVAVTIQGAATTGLAVDETGRGAAITFRGLFLIDFTLDVAELIEGTSSIVPRDLAMSARRILVLQPNSIEVRDSMSGLLLETFPIPGDAGMLAVGVADDDYVAVAGSEGIVSIRLDADGTLPRRGDEAEPSRFYEKIVSAEGRVALFDGEKIDWFETRPWGLDSSLRTIDPGIGTIDIAASGDLLCALLADSTVSCHDVSRASSMQIRVEGGTDVLPFAIHAIGTAVYVSLSRGCLSGQCENLTIVVDAAGGTLTKSDAMDGMVVDVTSAGDFAWVITDLPKEVRRLDVSDPAHPIVVATVSSEGNPVSIARSESSSSVYLLGSKLDVRDDTTLAKKGDLFDAWSADPSGRLSYIDQSVSIAGDCAYLAGRTFDSQRFEIRGALDWAPLSTPSSASPGKSTAIESGVFYLLSTHTIEAWTDVPRPTRRRPVNRGDR